MKKVLIVTNMPSPYRVQFFDELGKSCDLTVLYAERNEDEEHRDAAWYTPSQGHFRAITLEKRVKIGGQYVCMDVLDWLKQPFDEVLMFGYGLPTYMLAIAWLRLHRRPYSMELDGGLPEPEGKAKLLLKRFLVGGAAYCFSSGHLTDEVLCNYGANPEKITRYPFSSLCRGDILAEPTKPAEKDTLRRELGISEKHVILAVGQFIPRKGFDVLLQAAPALPCDTGLYFVGGEPTQEYRALADRAGVAVHFVGFRKKPELAKYYQAADLFVLPTREDIWGLVINEAMGYGLPVVTTDRCVAGVELVENGVNGYVVPVENPQALAEKIGAVFAADTAAMGRASLAKIQPYTIEGMAEVHKKALL